MTRLNEQVARLERAGSEYSGAMKKLREAIDALANTLVEVLKARGEREDNYQLADRWNISFKTNEYFLSGPDPTSTVDKLKLTTFNKERRAMLEFARLVADGWVERTVALFEVDTLTILEAATVIETGVANLKAET